MMRMAESFLLGVWSLLRMNGSLATEQKKRHGKALLGHQIPRMSSYLSVSSAATVGSGTSKMSEPSHVTCWRQRIVYLPFGMGGF